MTVIPASQLTSAELNRLGNNVLSRDEQDEHKARIRCQGNRDDEPSTDPDEDYFWYQLNRP